MLNGRRIAVLAMTSGDDAPGMNAAIRAVNSLAARATRLWQGLFANQVCLSLPEKVV